MKEDIQLNGLCYVLLQIGKAHPIAKFQHDLAWYPERSLTLLECVQYKPYVISIVTENPWLIACYKQEEVRVWDSEEQEWKWPQRQTYGASVNNITLTLLGINQTIPSCTLDGGEQVQKYIKTIKYPDLNS